MLTRRALIHKINELTPNCDCKHSKVTDCPNCLEIRRLGAALEGREFIPPSPVKQRKVPECKKHFRHTDDLYVTYSTHHIPPEITLGGILYKYIDTHVDGIKRTRKYRNEHEQQSVYITICSDVVMNAIAKYEVGDTHAKANVC